MNTSGKLSVGGWPVGRPLSPCVIRQAEAEETFLALGPGAKSWLVEAAASGSTRMRVKMAAVVELAALVGASEVDACLGLAATAGRFADDDRLLRHAHIVLTEGTSLRLAQATTGKGVVPLAT